MTRGARVYDYLWVGEGVGNLDAMREAVKAYPPYVVPCPDMTFAQYDNKDEPYLHAIPYMQFPMLQAGRPFTGERAMVPGVAYNTDPNDFWMRLCGEAWAQHKAHPEGPHAYGAWDAIPGRSETRPTYRYWLQQYLTLLRKAHWRGLKSLTVTCSGDHCPLPRLLPCLLIETSIWFWQTTEMSRSRLLLGPSTCPYLLAKDPPERIGR